MINKAIEILKRNFLLNVDMLQCIRRGSADILYTLNNSVVLMDTLSETCMIYMEEKNEEVLKVIPKDCSLFACHDEHSYSLIKNNFKIESEMKCCNVVYTKKENIIIPSNNIIIKLIDSQYEKLIIDYYAKTKIAEESYVKERIRNNKVFGAFIDNVLCGFIGIHAEGSIGMLEVFPEHRRKHIGMYLQGFLINNALANGDYPYGQVVENNIPSLKLQKKLGLEISKNYLYWLIK